MIIPIILSGGSGKRLWPLSRHFSPKQFHNILDENTLFQETLIRITNFPKSKSPIIIGNKDHKFLINNQSKSLDIEPSAIILEPIGRNTAPAIAVACHEALMQEVDPMVLVLPSDHLIKDKAAFFNALEKGFTRADDGKLIIFGVVPTKAETGYGYIQVDRSENKDNDSFKVKQFVEKPTKLIAEEYFSDTSYFWNSGMFLFKASTYLEELSKNCPLMIKKTVDAYEKAIRKNNFIELEEQSFAECENISIDYAVMEHTKNAEIVILDAGWSDLGSFNSLHDISICDENNNSLTGDILVSETDNSFLRSEKGLLVSIGLDNHIVIQTDDVTLIADKDKLDNLSKIVQELEKEGKEEVLFHQTVFRPWGSFQNIFNEGNHLVKKITVKPQQILSLQSHEHRAEHWVVVKGIARVTKGDTVFDLEENESTYISVKEKHRLENPSKSELLEIIEVQMGDILSEEDIIRYNDEYGRDSNSK